MKRQTQLRSNHSGSRLSSLVSRLLFFLIVLVSPQAIHAQTVHALVVGDASDWAGWGKFRPNITMDLLYMYVALAGHVPEAQLDLMPMTIESPEAGSPQAILQAINAFNVGPNDTMLFYFTGHGEVDNDGHCLSLERGKLHRSKILEAMRAKRPRLAVIITDSCNVRSDGEEFLAPAPGVEPPAVVSPIFKSLLFDPKGVVDVNSCSPSESAFFFVEKDDFNTPQGSLFSRTLTKYFDDNRAKPVSWDQLLHDVSIDVHFAFRRNYPNGATGAKGGGQQTEQTVYPISYPGKPEKQGPRTGFVIRDDASRPGPVITQVQPQTPAAEVVEIATRTVASLQPGQSLVEVNGNPVRTTGEAADIIRAAPQIIRLKVVDANGAMKEYLMRLRY